MKKFCVVYSYNVSTDACVEAKTKQEAINKVEEVLGDVSIDNVWEVKSDAVGCAS